MFSYEERLASFRNWPAEYKPVLVRKLALLGQYSVSTADGSGGTECVYCGHRRTEWRKEDEPLLVHLADSGNCSIFHLGRTSDRIRLFSLQSGAAPSLPTFLQFNIKKNVPFIFCGMCGCAAIAEHPCATKLSAKPIRPESVLYIKTFYLRFLRGDFLAEVDFYLTHQLFVPDRFHSVIRQILEAHARQPIKPAGSHHSALTNFQEVLCKHLPSIADSFRATLDAAEGHLVADILGAGAALE